MASILDRGVPDTWTLRAGQWLIAIRASLVCLTGPGPADAAGPIVLFGGRLRVGGLASGTISPKDDGYFNFVGYEAGITDAEVRRIGEHIRWLRRRPTKADTGS